MQESDFHLPNVGLPGYPNANSKRQACLRLVRLKTGIGSEKLAARGLWLRAKK